MVASASLFSQILALFQRSQFEGLVRHWRAQRHCKGFACWDQFVAMLFCQLAQAHSLREICGGLACCLGKLRHLGVSKAPNKSTLAYANEHRPWEVYQDLFYVLLDRCRVLAQQGQRRFRFKNKLFSLDATIIDLCLSLFPWAQFRQTKGAVKLHLLLDHDGYLPAFALITEGRVAEVRVAQHLDLAPGSIVVVDRGYTDYTLFGRWTQQKIFFVTRLKSNALYEGLEERRPPRSATGGIILCDQIIRLTGRQAQEQCPYSLRRILVWDPQERKEIVFLTNHLDLSAATIAQIYRERWQIEIFFKALKQNLKIKTFMGTSPNALKIQIWTALIALLILKYLQLRSQLSWSLSNLVALLRWNLFTYRDLWVWIDQPFQTPPGGPPEEQLALDLPGFGQHPATGTTPTGQPALIITEKPVLIA